MFLIATLLTLATPAADLSQRSVVVREAREYVALRTKRRVRMTHDEWDGTITLRTRDAKKVAKRLLETPSKLCPAIDADAKKIVLYCDTRRVRPKLIRRRGRAVLRLERTRGVPPRGAGILPKVSYENAPGWLGLSEPCPGKKPIVRAECRWRAGRRTSAARLYKEEIHGEHSSLAALRLGDIARSTGNLDLAIGWYRKAGRAGPFARLAMARICSMEGSCFDVARDARTYLPLNHDALPSPVRDEMILIAGLVYLYEDKPVRAATHILENGMASADGNACLIAPRVCSKIAREALRATQVEPNASALAFYYALPNRTRHKDALENAELASDTAHAFGAPSASAHLLAAVTNRVPTKRLPLHLRKTAERYLDGDDVARARSVLAYADEVDPKGRAGRAPLRVAVRRISRAPEVQEPDAPLPEATQARRVRDAISSALAPPDPTAGTELPGGDDDSDNQEKKAPTGTGDQVPKNTSATAPKTLDAESLRNAADSKGER